MCISKKGQTTKSLLNKDLAWQQNLEFCPNIRFLAWFLHRMSICILLHILTII